MSPSAALLFLLVQLQFTWAALSGAEQNPGSRRLLNLVGQVHDGIGGHLTVEKGGGVVVGASDLYELPQSWRRLSNGTALRGRHYRVVAAVHHRDGDLHFREMLVEQVAIP